MAINDERLPAPRNTEWRNGTLHGRTRIKGRLRRWSLRTADVELARVRVAEDIERMKAEAFYGERPPLAIERHRWRNCPMLSDLRDPAPSILGYIYVAGFRDYVKIGWSATVKARLVDLQNGLPENLVVYGLIEGTAEEEMALHRRFSRLRLNREWFRLSGPLEIWIGKHCPVDFKTGRGMSRTAESQRQWFSA